METVKISNIVATFRLGQFFSERRLKWIARHGYNTELNPNKFHSVIMRLRRPCSCDGHTPYTISALVFRNGKVMLSGARSTVEVSKMAGRISRYIQSALNEGAKLAADAHDYGKCQVKNLNIHNIVGSMTMPFRIHVEHLHNDITLSQKHTKIFKSSRFCTTVFPALRTKFILTNQSHTLAVNIFISGKVVMTGALNIEEITSCAQSISELLKSYDRKLFVP